jgi:hypothetical protein
LHPLHHRFLRFSSFQNFKEKLPHDKTQVYDAVLLPVTLLP